VHPTQSVEIFGNVSTPFATLVIYYKENFTEIVPCRGTFHLGV